MGSSCSTITVVSGDSCGSLAARCGISAADFTTFNPSPTLCSSLAVGQKVCCSAGGLAVPVQNPDGSCASYTVVPGDTCAALAASNGITVADLNAWNVNTWGWETCNDLQLINICLSTGTPPMPPPVTNAICGPQVPGTANPGAGANLSALNPCPLNACCDIWGQCGTTSDFCTPSSTGAPGTAALGTNGCISNCGTEIISGSPPAEFRRVAYFEAFNIQRPCLNMDITQIDTTKYTHVHFAFLDITSTFDVDTSQFQDQFNKFVKLTGIKRVASFVGWTMSTDPDTYTIFRNAVSTSANQQTFASKLVAFVKQFGLDGLDIDWEYPGEQDIPGIPADSFGDGQNLAAFLTVLRSQLPSGVSLSIATPAGYWYLRAFPIATMANSLDYIIYMTYDLHGQWDYGSAFDDPGCPAGSCLRSHVNLTETLNAFSMITKAGVNSNKLVVGVTSYGRAFKMTTAGCTGPLCTFTGPSSGATPGPCTQTAGYIADAEINQIIAAGNVQTFHDASSDTDILVYDSVQWVAYMNDATKASRTTTYQGLNMGGVSDWAVDLQAFVAPSLHTG
ncbi:class V chitinase-like protein [Mycena sanguinolenta]|nr:class V chitinase-like protein [Mycena sanguinolenta]